MDEDELADRQKTAVKTTANYDTFGDTATEMAKKAAAADAQARPSAIPGAMFKDLITPVPDSIGRQHAHVTIVPCLSEQHYAQVSFWSIAATTQHLL